MGASRSPNTNMTPEDRERGRANLQRLMKDLYRPTLQAAQKSVSESLEITLGSRPAQSAPAAPASSRVKALKASRDSVRVSAVAGGIAYTLERPGGVGAELAAQIDAASSANQKAQELARERHFQIILGVIGFRRQFGELEDVDKERIRAELEMLREVDVVAAVALAQMAAYQAAVATRDPRVLDTVASRALKALPPKVKPVTIADVNALVAALPGSLRKIRDQYLDVARRSAPPEVWPTIERGTKQMFDPYIRMAESDQNGTDVVLDTSRSPSDSPASTPRESAKPVDPEARKAALHAYASVLLDTTSALFPALGVVLKGIEGVGALAKGDYKGAIDCAVSMIPAGGLAKEALLAGAEIVKSKV